MQCNAMQSNVDGMTIRGRNSQLAGVIVRVSSGLWKANKTESGFGFGSYPDKIIERMSITATLFPMLADLNSNSKSEELQNNINSSIGIGIGSGDAESTGFKNPHFPSSANGDHISKLFLNGTETGEGNGLRVPKFIQAVFTLVVCGLLLICTLGVILRTKRCCRKETTIKGHDIKIELTPDQLEYMNDIEYSADRKTKDKTKNTTPQEKEFLHQALKTHICPRSMGPFTDEAIDFAGESYKKIKKEGADKSGAKVTEVSSKTPNAANETQST